MTERDPGADRDYPDGSVGRYVRERWGAARPPRPHVPPAEPPAPRPAEVDAPDAAAGEDVWAYQPDAAWRRRDNPSAGPGPALPEITETERTQTEPGHSSAHDPFAGVEYGS